MSRIFFHQLAYPVAALAGSERAWYGHFGGRLLSFTADPQAFRPFMPGYVLDAFKDHNETPFRTWLNIGELAGPSRGNGAEKQVSLFELQLNTLLVTGNRTVKWMARIHGQCEVHAWIDDKDRSYFINLLDEGMKIGILRRDAGYAEVQEALRKGAGPVVTSYSVCDQFPNSSVAGYDDDAAVIEWEALTPDERWDHAFEALHPSLQLKPDDFEKGTFRFGEGLTVFDINSGTHV